MTKQRAAYGSGTVQEREPGVWRGALVRRRAGGRRAGGRRAGGGRPMVDPHLDLHTSVELAVIPHASGAHDRYG
jgi:hypothetical protein